MLEKYGTKALQYGATQGVPELRELIASRYGVPVSQVQITTSSQQGIDVCARVFLDPGDVVLAANPIYLGALQSFKAYRAEVVDLRDFMAGEGVVSQTHGHPWPCPVRAGIPSGIIGGKSFPEREGPTAAPAGALRVGRGRSEAEAVCDTIPSSVGNYWYFRIAADRFLRNMVRATVGTLIEVGRGKHSPEWVAELIASGTRGDAGESVPGHALFLNKVLY